MKFINIIFIFLSLIILTGVVFSTTPPAPPTSNEIFTVTIALPNPYYGIIVSDASNIANPNSVSTSSIQNSAVTITKLNAASPLPGSFLKINSAGTGLEWGSGSSGSGTTYTSTSPISISGTNVISLNDSGIISSKIANNAVTSEKISDNAVISTKIVANAVTSTKISDNAVTSTKIVNNAITSTKISASAINLSHINASNAAANKYLKINTAGTGLEWGTVSSTNIDIVTTNGSGPHNIPANSLETWNITCPTGYTVIGGGFDVSSASGYLEILQSKPNGNPGTGESWWQCQARNNTSSTTQYGTCYAVCISYN